mmetsp:Transcript_23048/g.72511  ORF Transcript_23048/g.72511 Transcript_23048/m.72511 type:complete len:205 (+) Transcript_23048:18-632(+)
MGMGLCASHPLTAAHSSLRVFIHQLLAPGPELRGLPAQRAALHLQGPHRHVPAKRRNLVVRRLVPQEPRVLTQQPPDVASCQLLEGPHVVIGVPDHLLHQVVMCTRPHDLLSRVAHRDLEHVPEVLKPTVVVLVDRVRAGDPDVGEQEHGRAARELLLQRARVAVAREVQQVAPPRPAVQGDEAGVRVHHCRVQEVVLEKGKVK